MASGRIELELGGKYSAGQMFAQAQKDTKRFVQENKDAMNAGRQAVDSLARAFDDKLSGSIRVSYNLLGDLVRGGLWGAMANLASQAIGIIADKLKEAKEQAKALGEALDKHVAEGFKKVFASASSDLAAVRTEMTQATKDADAMLAALNGKVADSAKAQIAQLHVETLQKITDATSDAAKSALQAQEAFTAAVIRGNAAMDAANNAAYVAQEKRKIAEERSAAADEALATTKENQDLLEKRYSSVLMRQTQYKEQIANILTLSVNNEEYASANAEKLAHLRERLADLESSNAEVLATITQGRKDVAAREADVAAAQGDLATTARAVTAANRKLETVKAENAAAEAEAKAKKDAANAALQKETEAAEAAAKAKAREAEQSIYIEKIKAFAVEKDIEYAEYVTLATKALEEGYSQETATNLIRARYRAALEEAAQQKEEESKGGSGSTTVKAIAQGVKEGLNGLAVNTSVNTGEVGSGVDQSDEVITLGNLQRDVRDDQRKSRDHMNAVKQSSAAMQSYLKGQMAPEVAEKFGKKLKENGWTKADMESAYSKALKAQLLSPAERKEELKAVLRLVKYIEKLGLK